jgi:hypothetical protein
MVLISFYPFTKKFLSNLNIDILINQIDEYYNCDFNGHPQAREVCMNYIIECTPGLTVDDFPKLSGPSFFVFRLGGKSLYICDKTESVGFELVRFEYPDPTRCRMITKKLKQCLRRALKRSTKIPRCKQHLRTRWWKSVDNQVGTGSTFFRNFVPKIADIS